MNDEQVRLERRAAQRFDLHVPVSVRLVSGEREGGGFTQNLSARGALLHTDLPIAESDAVEITLVMPSEITLAENMRVRCRGKVLRVLSAAVGAGSVAAVHLVGYEFLPEVESGSSGFARISALHEHPHAAEAGDRQERARARSSVRH
jgi:PilZ domain